MGLALVLLMSTALPLVSVAQTSGGPGTPWSDSDSASNLPEECTRLFSDDCYHMRGELNGLDSPKIDVVLVVAASAWAERDLRAMQQVIDMYEAGIKYIAFQEGWDWLGDGIEFHIMPMVLDMDQVAAGEFTTYPIVDPEIVVITNNPLLTVVQGIGIDPPAFFFGEGGIGEGPCHGLGNPFDIEAWEALPGFDSHHDGRSGTYNEDCGGSGGNICFAINNAIDPVPGVVENVLGMNTFDLVAHEVGHCLRLGHVGDAGDHTTSAVPRADIMAYTGQSFRKCVSSLDVEQFAVAMSPFLDVNGDGVVHADKSGSVNMDRFYNNDHIGQGGNAFQVQHPSDHYYASHSGEASDCPQPDVGLDPTGAVVDFCPEPGACGGSGGTGSPAIVIASPSDGSEVPADLVTVSGSVDREGAASLAATIEAGDSVNAGDPLVLSGSASGGQSDQGFTCAWSDDADGAYGDPSVCETTVTFSSAGRATITLQVSDGTSTAQRQKAVDVRIVGLPVPDPGYVGSLFAYNDALELGACVGVSNVIALGTEGVDPVPKYPAGTEACISARSVGPTPACALLGEVGGMALFNEGGSEVYLREGVQVAQDTAAGTGTQTGCRISAGNMALPLTEGRYYLAAFYDLPAGRTWITSDAGHATGLKPIDVVGMPDVSDPASEATREGLPRAPVDQVASHPGAGGGSGEPCAGLTLVADDAGDDSTATPGVAQELLCLGAGIDGDRFYFGIEVEDATQRQHPVTIWYDVYFEPQFGILDETTQLVSVEYSNGGGITAFWDVAGNDPTGLLFPSYFPDPTRDDVQANLDGNQILVHFPISYLGVPADGDTIAGIFADANDCGNANPCNLRHLDFVPDTKDGVFTFGAEPDDPLTADAGGPYSGESETAIAISGSFSGGDGSATCAWSTADDGAFDDAAACDTTVTFDSDGAKTVSLTVTDGTGSDADDASVTVGGGADGERVEVAIGDDVLASAQVDTSSESTAGWETDVDLSGRDGQVTLTATWFDADGTVLAQDSVDVDVAGAVEESIITVERIAGQTLERDGGDGPFSGTVIIEGAAALEDEAPKPGTVEVQVVTEGETPGATWDPAVYDEAAGTWSFEWDTEALAEGGYDIHARLLDGDSAEAASDQVLVLVGDCSAEGNAQGCVENAVPEVLSLGTDKLSYGNEDPFDVAVSGTARDLNGATDITSIVLTVTDPDDEEEDVTVTERTDNSDGTVDFSHDLAFPRGAIPGTYSVLVVVTDSEGATDSTSVDFDIVQTVEGLTIGYTGGKGFWDFGTFAPGTTGHESVNEVTIGNNMGRTVQVDFDMTDFVGPDAIVVLGNAVVHVDEDGDGTPERSIDYDGAIITLGDLPDLDTWHLQLVIEQLPPTLQQGAYGATFGVYPVEV